MPSKSTTAPLSSVRTSSRSASRSSSCAVTRNVGGFCLGCAAGDRLDQRDLVAGADLGRRVEAVLLVDRDGEGFEERRELRAGLGEAVVELRDRDGFGVELLLDVAAHELAELREEPNPDPHD